MTTLPPLRLRYESEYHSTRCQLNALWKLERVDTAPVALLWGGSALTLASSLVVEGGIVCRFACWHARGDYWTLSLPFLVNYIARGCQVTEL